MTNDPQSGKSLRFDKDLQLSKHPIFYSVFLILNIIEFIILQFVFELDKASAKFPVGIFFVYLTILHGLLQTFYLAICVTELFLYDRSDWVKEKIPRIRHWMFGSLAFPVANFVGFSFFALVHFFGDSTLDLIRICYAHGGIVIIIWGDAIFCNHIYSDFNEKDKKKSRIKLFKQSTIPVIAVFCYLIWNIVAYQFNHIFPYEFQNRLKDEIGYSILIYFGEAVLMWIFFWFGYYVNRRIHQGNSDAETHPFISDEENENTENFDSLLISQNSDKL